MRIWLAVCLALAASPVFADAKRDLQARYDQIEKFLIKEDVKGLEAMHTPDYRDSDFTGAKTDAKSFPVQMKRTFDQIQIQTAEVVVKKVTVKNGVAQVEVGVKIRAKAGRDTFDVVSTNSDSWVKVGSVWKLKVARTTARTTKMNGKVVPEGRG